MSTMPAPKTLPSAPIPFPERRRFTVQEYDQMVKAGVFGEDDRLELIEGEVVAMSPINSHHAGRVNRLNKLLTRRLGDRVLVSVQNPVELPHSEPQPDLALLRPRADDYAKSHPKPKDVLLLIEVADTSADYDRTVKIRLYARAGIPEVWLVDLTEKQVEVYRKPGASGYKEKRTLSGREALSPAALAGVTLTVADMLND